jgi:hypothetical protein
MFQFAGLASLIYLIQPGIARVCPGGVSSFGNPRIRLLPATRGFSQVATPFIASWCQGIHRMPLVAWPKAKCRMVLLRPPCSLLRLQVRNVLGSCATAFAVATLAFNCQRTVVWAVREQARTALSLSARACARHPCAYLPAGHRARRGGDDRARTDDPLLAKQVLSQLSYIPLSPRGIARVHKPSGGGPEWNRTTDLTLIRRAL